MEQTTKMTTKVISRQPDFIVKTGAGEIIGLSTWQRRPGERLKVHDGPNTLILELNLDEAYPPQVVESELGRYTVPGITVGMLFNVDLHVESPKDLQVQIEFR